MRLFAIRLDDGFVITSPDWWCPADVAGAGHGAGRTQEKGVLVYRDNDDEEWRPWPWQATTE